MAYEGQQRLGYLLASALLGLACASAPIDGVVRPESGGAFLESLPGPLPNFGPFDSYSDALIAACPLILSKPNATAGRPGDQDFPLRWRLSKEYCAWLYYTPDDKYELSMLTDQSGVGELDRMRSCILPALVDDRRYPPSSLKYIFALHNHPRGSSISEPDVRYIVSKALEHGFQHPTKQGAVNLAIVAFFSNSSSLPNPTCDGFHQYIPATHQVLRWTRLPDRWQCTQTGRVSWEPDGSRFSIERMNAPCPVEGAP